MIPNGQEKEMSNGHITGVAEGTETRIWAKKEGNARSLKAIAIPEDVKRRLGG